MKRFVWILTLLLLLSLTACGEATQSASIEPTQAELTFDDRLKEAQQLYEECRFSESLECYLAVMEQSGKNMEARLGAAQCQVALGLEDAAVKNLLLAQKINPEEKRVYTDLAALAQEQESEALIREVIALAEAYQVDSFLELLPDPPVFSQEPGVKEELISLEISSPIPEARVYYSWTNLQQNISVETEWYEQPLRLMNGVNTVSAYIISDGMPSKTVTATYEIQRTEEEVTFQDPAFENTVRATIDKLSGPITNLDCEQLTSLSFSESDLYDWKIHSLEDLHLFPSLEEITLSGIDSLTDFSPLAYCPKLEEIALSGIDSLTDFSPLAYCPKLTKLAIANANLTDISFVQYVPGLQSVSIWGNPPILDLSPLENLQNLKTVSFTYVGLQDIQPLAKISSLEEITLFTCDVKNISELAHCAGEITKLDISGNPITDAEDVIRAMPALQYLAIDDTSISDYCVLKELPELSDLSIYGIRGIDFSAISELEKLQGLYVFYIKASYQNDGYLFLDAQADYTAIQDLSFLDNMQNLTSLMLSNVQSPQQLEHLYGLQNLWYLNFRNSSVTNDRQAMSDLNQALPKCGIAWD